MLPHRLYLFLLTLIAALAFCMPSLQAQLEPLYFDEGMVGLGLALRTLLTTSTLLCITAHPDDEDDALLAYLRRGLGMRTGLLTLTRGEGGQNEIGSELFEALGLLRTGELLSVQRYLDHQQFFSRAFEFGYSFSVEETFEKWGKQATLGDIVRIIRQFKPLVILTLPPTGKGGGQHHQATGLLATEAFHAAGDPKQFPEQIAAGLSPWQAKKLYYTQFFEGSRETSGTPVRISVGDMDPLLGQSYAQIGAHARSNHRCQGMNILPQAGEHYSSYVLADALPGLKPSSGMPEKSLFDGLDTSLMGLMLFIGQEETQAPFMRGALLALQTNIDLASQSFQRSNFEEVAGYVYQGYLNCETLRKQVRDSQLSNVVKAHLLPYLEYKASDFARAVHAANFVQLEAFQVRNPRDQRRVDAEEGVSQTDGLVTRGETFHVAIRFTNNSSRPVMLAGIYVRTNPMDGAASSLDVKVPGFSNTIIEPHKSYQLVHQVTVPNNAPYTQPYWFRKSKSSNRYEVTDAALEGQPFSAPLFSVGAVYSPIKTVQAGSITLETPIQYRWYDPGSAKERRMTVDVVPALSLTMNPELLIVPLEASAIRRSISVNVHNNMPGAVTVRISLKLPPGWACSPETATAAFSRENEDYTARFEVRVPGRLAAGSYSVRAEAQMNNELFDSGYQTVAYHHIQTRRLFHPAETVVQAFDVKIPVGMKIGYIMGVGDEVPQALAQLGAIVKMLQAEDLVEGDLSSYDAIVTGIRAYKDRTDLQANNARLLEYVKNGGHLVVQYNKYEFNRAAYGPYPASISRPHDRVTDENSSVKILLPDHPIFNLPNRITESDWKGWVQERGLYFLGQWDLHYQPLLELQDPFEYNNQPKRGSLMLASYGKGTYIYTGLGFFRQLAEGVSGAYRLFANIVSLNRASKKL